MAFARSAGRAAAQRPTGRAEAGQRRTALRPARCARRSRGAPRYPPRPPGRPRFPWPWFDRREARRSTPRTWRPRCRPDRRGSTRACCRRLRSPPLGVRRCRPLRRSDGRARSGDRSWSPRHRPRPGHRTCRAGPRSDTAAAPRCPAGRSRWRRARRRRHSHSTQAPPPPTLAAVSPSSPTTAAPRIATLRARLQPRFELSFPNLPGCL